MTHDEFQTTIQYMVKTGELYLPHGMFPGSFPGGVHDLSNEEAWTAYTWNPPQYLEHLYAYAERDPIASPHYAWAFIESFLEPAMVEFLIPHRCRTLRRECHRRITEAYGEATFNEELALRLRNGQTPAQDIERERLRGIYQTLKTSVKTMTRAELEAFDPTDDTHWAPPEDDA